MDQRALSEIAALRELNEDLWVCQLPLGSINLKRGMLGEALVSFEKAYRSAPWNAVVIGHLAGTYFRSGSRNRANETYDVLRSLPSHSKPLGMAIFHAICGEPDQATMWLEIAIQERHPMVLMFIRNPTMQIIRTSFRWPGSLKLVNLFEAT